MQKIDSKIIKFIKDHHVLTLATSNNNEPYCANCFYAYLEEENAFVFTSEIETKHIKDSLKQNFVAGSIILETKVVGKIQGIQFNGNLYKPENELIKKARKQYMKAFPYAALLQTTMWVLELSFIKMTDNRLGFGKKLIWEK
ncbi:MAG: hypothetical protein JXR51_11545 [Bacteroidales bacterium]|nr:hypothetical protein [Bacteroidales bacterium]MBN2757804.1 hypothetical protein [Bacteroidales bacterium]